MPRFPFSILHFQTFLKYTRRSRISPPERLNFLRVARPMRDIRALTRRETTRPPGLQLPDRAAVLFLLGKEKHLASNFQLP
jgi:hypothetical protein